MKWNEIILLLNNIIDNATTEISNNAIIDMPGHLCPPL